VFAVLSKVHQNSPTVIVLTNLVYLCMQEDKKQRGGPRCWKKQATQPTSDAALKVEAVSLFSELVEIRKLTIALPLKGMLCSITCPCLKEA